MGWLNDLLAGKSKEAEKETPQPAKKADWFDGIMKDEAISKTASIADEREKHVKNLSTDALAHIYTELILKKENKKIPEHYVEEYLKQKDAVMKNREKIEAEVLKLIPPHSQEAKFKKLASKATVVDVDSIWLIKDVDGQEVIIRATPDEKDMKKESIREVKANDTVFVKEDLVKNKSFDIAEKDELGVIEDFDNLFVDSSFICCNFEKTGRCWIKADQVVKLTAEELDLVKSAREYTSLYGPLADYMRSKFNVTLKEAGLKQLELEITSALGKSAKTFSEVPSELMDKVANDFIQDPEYVSLYDRPVIGQEQATDNMNQQVPVVYRDTDDGKYTPNTKDFGEVYHQDKLSPEKISSLDVEAKEDFSKWETGKLKNRFNELTADPHTQVDKWPEIEAINKEIMKREKNASLSKEADTVVCDICGNMVPKEGTVMSHADGYVCTGCQKDYENEMHEPYPQKGTFVTKAMSNDAQKFISDHIAKHIEEYNMNYEQATAAAYDEARKQGFDVPEKTASLTDHFNSDSIEKINNARKEYNKRKTELSPEDLKTLQSEIANKYNIAHWTIEHDSPMDAESELKLSKLDSVALYGSKCKNCGTLSLQDRSYSRYPELCVQCAHDKWDKEKKELAKSKSASVEKKSQSIQYVDSSNNTIKRPEELGIADSDSAPEEVKDASGKTYKKQKLAV